MLTVRVACVGLLAWIPAMGYLGRRQAPWSGTLGWMAFDVAELAALVATARLLRQHDKRVAASAGLSAALLLGDAVVDMVISAPGTPRALAVAMAALVELPLALLCCSIAVKALSGSGASPSTTTTSARSGARREQAVAGP